MSKLKQQPSYTMTLSDLEDIIKRLESAQYELSGDAGDFDLGCEIIDTYVEELETIKTNLLDNSFLGEKRKVGKNRYAG